MRSLCLLLIAGFGLSPCCAQPAVQMRIVLEQQTGSTFRVVNPQHIFKTGDKIRFRISSSTDGILYVSDRAASGKYSELFPVRGADNDNHLEHGKDYRIPAAARAWFRIEKPAGYETVFFTFTSSPLLHGKQIPVTAPPAMPMPQAAPAELIPRCDDAMLRARGDCLDTNAGPAAVPGSDTLTPRDVSIVQGPDGSVVIPTGPGDTPIVYEFRIAHR